MASLDERVAYLERRMEVHTAVMADLRADVRGIRAELGQVRSELRTEAGQLRTEMGQLRAEMHAGMGELRSDIRRLDQKMDRHFTWLVGMLVGVLLALLGLTLQIARIQPL